MTIIRVRTRIKASPSVCFDLARDIGLHCRSTRGTGERAVSGVTEGLIGPGQWVTFEARHLGVRQRLTARITEFDPPHRFVDTMTEGAFKSMRHVHEFLPHAGGTLMQDTLIWEAPLGVLGILADLFFLKRYMRRFLRQRNRVLRRVAESRDDGVTRTELP